MFLPLAAVLLTASACKKDEIDALPKATQSGKNTGGCLVNGEGFVAAESGGSLLSNPTPALSGGFAFDSVYYVSLNGRYQNRRATILLFLRTRVAGTYPLNRTTSYYPQGDPLQIFSHATVTLAGSGGETFVTSAQHTGQVVLTRMDKHADISAGTFEFTAASTFDPRKTITITKGRFDRRQ
ncbi:hypothetical protein BEN47_13635 [Hymenobacter lapidarius]|uniref:Uncharacterized protein n=1 Tax=Hymenobacter lapidarius TaxID=1908237 RepID=A0A1G1T566_9BACT|nr:hypothetical protein BEN47_13635 [Hymenobacter lapidarius]